MAAFPLAGRGRAHHGERAGGGAEEEGEAVLCEAGPGLACEGAGALLVERDLGERERTDDAGVVAPGVC